jgi:hypothetical protein
MDSSVVPFMFVHLRSFSPLAIVHCRIPENGKTADEQIASFERGNALKLIPRPSSQPDVSRQEVLKSG